MYCARSASAVFVRVEKIRAYSCAYSLGEFIVVRDLVGSLRMQCAPWMRMRVRSVVGKCICGWRVRLGNAFAGGMCGGEMQFRVQVLNDPRVEAIVLAGHDLRGLTQVRLSGAVDLT